MLNPRIYIVAATFYPIFGGSETQALIQGRCLRERGYTTTIITFRHDRAWPLQEMMEGVPVIRIAGILLGGREKLPRLLQRLLYLAAMVVMVWTLWQHRRNYDILHVQHFNTVALPTAFACWLTKKPMVIVVQNAGTGDKGGDLEGLESMGKPFVRLVHFLLERISVVVVVISSRMKGYLAAHDFNLAAVQFIPNGVDITRFSLPSTDASSDERAHVVVCVARLSYQKGIDVLLRAWCLVQKEALSLQARLIIVGDGPLQIQLEEMARELGIADSVEFTGARSEISTQLHRGGFAVLPSRWEGMPVAIVEAMACGLPCVATRVSGSEDIIQHGVNGLLVEPEDYQGMAEALLTLLRDPALAQQYGHAARETIERHYALEIIISAYIKLYHEMIEHKGILFSNSDTEVIVKA